jgi:hypothetical protein
VDRGHEEPAQRQVVELLDDVEDVTPRHVLPSTSHQPAAAQVGGDDQLAREEARRCRQPVGLLDRTRTKHDTVGPFVQ